MKRNSYLTSFSIVFILFILCITGCEPEIIIKKIPTYRECNEEPAPLYLPGDMIYGRVAGLKNCLPFLASAVAFIGEDTSHLVGLEITTYEEIENNYINKELMGIGALSYGIGTWSLLSDSIPNLQYQYYKTVKEFEVVEDSYKLDTDYEYNRIAITSFNMNDQRIMGWFECRYILTSLVPSGINPDTILFSECHFDALDPP